MSRQNTAGLETKGKVLVVDDEQSVRLSLEAILSRDFEVVGASNVVEALNVLSDTPVEVVITDYSMPGQTGLDLIQAITQRFPDVMVILVTGYADAPEIRGAERNLGAIRVIAKPYDPSRLVRWVSNAVGLAKLRQATNRLGRKGRMRS